MKNNLILVGLVFLCVNNYAMDGSAENIRSMLALAQVATQARNLLIFVKKSCLNTFNFRELSESLERLNKEEKLQIWKLDMSLCCGMDDSE